MTIPNFAPVTEWPKRGRIARERTPEEIAMRDALIVALQANAAGVIDPETYTDTKAARNAANRYRSLLAPVMPSGQRLESVVEPNGKRFAVQMRLGAVKPRKAKAPAAEVASA
jgi:hypothetical protein